MSGGVDSSVAALLLKNQGYITEGLFMKNWEEDDTDTYCMAEKDLKDAQDVCDKLNIPLHRVNFSVEYWENVFENFLEEYQQGRTPNPDILCNKYIKFTAFLNYAKRLGADFIATGHYAQKKEDDDFSLLCEAKDKKKDQTYFLYTLDQHQLKHSLFPLGKLEKEEVRLIANQEGFSNYNKKDSTGICFIGERHFKKFLNRYLPAQPGNIVTPEGKKIGEHTGLMYYTLGQRQGLGIGGKKGELEAPWYVAEKNLKTKELIVVQTAHHPLLFSKNLICKKIHWIAKTPHLPYTCVAKIRYRQLGSPCDITYSEKEKNYFISFHHEQRAIAPGQSIVFYDHENCLGGGIIEGSHTLKSMMVR